MNPRLRNLFYFLLGSFLVLALSAPVFAGAVKMQPNTWYGNNSGVTKGFTGTSSPPVWAANDGVWNPPTYKSSGVFKKNGLDIPFSANQDFYPEDLFPPVKQGLKGGFKDLVKGSFGLGPILGGLALTWAMQQGFEWMDQAKCAAQVSCWQQRTSYPQFYNASKDLRIEARTVPRTLLKIYPNSNCCSPSVLADLDKWCKQYGYTGAHPSVKTACQTPGYGTVDYFYNIDQIGSATPNGAVPSSVSPVPDATVETALQQAVTQNFPQAFQAALDDKTILEIPQDRPLTLVPAPPVVAPATVTTSTQTNADGSTQAVTETSAEVYSVRCVPNGILGCDNLAPYSISTGTTTTTQTTTCGQGGTCVTDVKTSEKSEPLPDKTPEQKFCELNPKALECLEVGEIPDSEIPTETKQLNFTWTPFSVSATCPAPYSMTIKGKTYLYQWTYYCDFATKTKPFILILAFIGAYFIIMGARKE